MTAKEFKDFADRVWEKPRWQRGAPKAKTIGAVHRKLACALGIGHRHAMKEWWRESRAVFYEHRRRQFAHRERLRYLPFVCGGGTRSAIDCSIMWCESGGSYSAENSSGAFGKYQLMPEWWSHLGRRPTPAEQDRIAYELWDGAAGRSNWVC